MLWISERKDVLSGVFFMLTLWAHARYARQRTLARYAAVAFFFALGLMSKSMLVTLPCVLLLLDWWPLRRFGWPAVVEKLPLLALSAASSLVQLHVSTGLVEEFPLRLRLGNALLCYAGYLGQWLWPAKLAVLYPYQLALPVLPVVLSALLLLGITVLSLVLLRRCPYVFVGWAWYLGTLFPVCGLIQVGAQSMADRYSYLPLIGPAFAVTWAVGDLIARRKWQPRVFATAAAVILGLCAVLTVRQIPVWHDSETLFRRAIAVTHENPIAHRNLGVGALRFGAGGRSRRGITNGDPARPG